MGTFSLRPCLTHLTLVSSLTRVSQWLWVFGSSESWPFLVPVLIEWKHNSLSSSVRNPKGLWLRGIHRLSRSNLPLEACTHPGSRLPPSIVPAVPAAQASVLVFRPAQPYVPSLRTLPGPWWDCLFFPIMFPAHMTLCRDLHGHPV